MTRESFLGRVREAAAAGRMYRVLTPADLATGPGKCAPIEDLAGRLAAEITAVGGSAHLVDDLPAARREIGRLLDEYRPRRALCWQHPLLARLELPSLLAASNVESLDYDHLRRLPAQERQAAILAADIGISSAQVGVAETGTLIVAAAPGRERLASLAPPVHVAVVASDQLVADLYDWFDRAAADGLESLSSNITLITGPSKTGDLELRLTTGVHGPAHWHVVIARSLGPPAPPG